tara:strand:- start:6844 stop:7389 length:546 start_codon:yes stop_codon:yes gene_type:complete
MTQEAIEPEVHRDRMVADDLRMAMRQLAASVSVVAARSGDDRGGLTMTAVCSVSLDPPTMLICVNRSSSSHDLIAEAKCFSVNILNEDQRLIAEVFAGQTGIADWDGRFAAGDAEWIESEAGVPILKEARANVICRTRETVVSGSHTIFLGDVVEVLSHDHDDGHALLYSQGDYRGVSDLD